MRTKFTSEQISKLENTFCKHKYLGATQRRKILAAGGTALPSLGKRGGAGK